MAWLPSYENRGVVVIETCHELSILQSTNWQVYEIEELRVEELLVLLD